MGRSSKPELKNLKKSWKLNELPEPRSKNNDLNCLENLKNFLSDLRKLVVPPLPKSNLTNDEKLKWLNSDEIWKNPTWLMNPPLLLFERNKPTKLLNCLKPLTISNESNKSSKKKNPR